MSGFQAFLMVLILIFVLAVMLTLIDSLQRKYFSWITALIFGVFSIIVIYYAFQFPVTEVTPDLIWSGQNLNNSLEKPVKGTFRSRLAVLSVGDPLLPWVNGRSRKPFSEIGPGPKVSSLRKSSGPANGVGGRAQTWAGDPRSRSGQAARWRRDKTGQSQPTRITRPIYFYSPSI